MTKLAGLPMYDVAEITAATDEFWQILSDDLRRRGVDDVPSVLTRPDHLSAFWSDPALLIGQTCGYPFVTGLCGEAIYVATPCYATRFSDGPTHRSVIVTRRGSAIKTLRDARGGIAAVNMPDSNSGMNLFRLEIAKLGMAAPFFDRIVDTGAHRRSMQAVADGEADLAAIDGVTFALIAQADPALTDALVIIAESEASPALPFITSGKTDATTLRHLRDGLARVVADEAHAKLMRVLMLGGIAVLPAHAYQRVSEIETRAIALGYPELR